MSKLPIDIEFKIKFNDTGKEIKIKNPRTLLLAFSDIDTGDILDSVAKDPNSPEVRKKVKEMLDKITGKEGGIQLIGTHNDIEFTFLLLLDAVIKSLGSGHLGSLMIKMMAVIDKELKAEEQLARQATKHDKSIN